MLNDKTVRGTNFTCSTPAEGGWTSSAWSRPTCRCRPGASCSCGTAGSAGLEMSLNVVRPARDPFLHRHRENDEVYVVVGGRGQFLVDGECIDVAEGSVLRSARQRHGPGGTTRRAAVLPLPPVPGDSVIQGGTLDGQKVEGKPAWPE